MMSKLKNTIAHKFAKQGQVVILDSSIRKYEHHQNSHRIEKETRRIKYIEITDHQAKRRLSVSSGSCEGKKSTLGEEDFENKSDHSNESYALQKCDRERRGTEEDDITEVQL